VLTAGRYHSTPRHPSNWLWAEQRQQHLRQKTIRSISLQIIPFPFRIDHMQNFHKLVLRFSTAFFLFSSLTSMAAEPFTNPMEQTEAPVPARPSWSGVAQEVLVNALSLTGIKYRSGGSSPETGFDCSGFVRYVFQQAASLTLPHSARALAQLGQSIPIKELQPGDLVFFNTLKSTFSHVGIYLGNNRFIHAASAGKSIDVTNLDDAYWSKRFTGARRLDTSEQTAPSISE
jgi:cell wall-associated NlpC family hydrolase